MTEESAGGAASGSLLCVSRLMVICAPFSYPLDPDAFFMAGLGPAHVEERHAQYKIFEDFLTGLTGKGCDAMKTFLVARMYAMRMGMLRPVCSTAES